MSNLLSSISSSSSSSSVSSSSSSSSSSDSNDGYYSRSRSSNDDYYSNVNADNVNEDGGSGVSAMEIDSKASFDTSGLQYDFSSAPPHIGDDDPAFNACADYVTRQSPTKEKAVDWLIWFMFWAHFYYTSYDLANSALDRLKAKYKALRGKFNNVHALYTSLRDSPPVPPATTPHGPADHEPTLEEINKELAKEKYSVQRYTKATAGNISDLETTAASLQAMANSKKARLASAQSSYHTSLLRLGAVLAVLANMKAEYVEIEQRRVSVKRRREAEEEHFKAAKRQKRLIEQQQEQQLLLESAQQRLLRLDHESSETSAQDLAREEASANQACAAEEDELQAAGDSILLGDDDAAADWGFEDYN